MKSFGDNKVKLNEVFTIERGGRRARYKIIKHPNFPGSFALVCDHPFIHYNTPTRDEKYIINGGSTIEMTYEQAVYHT